MCLEWNVFFDFKNYLTTSICIKDLCVGYIDKESCQFLFIKNVVDWLILDPKGKSIEEVRNICNQIEIKVINLINILEKNM
jgi:arsenate reductase (thioredoxin)